MGVLPFRQRTESANSETYSSVRAGPGLLPQLLPECDVYQMSGSCLPHCKQRDSLRHRRQGARHILHHRKVHSIIIRKWTLTTKQGTYHVPCEQHRGDVGDPDAGFCG